jgi:hypothetical protein
LANSSAVPQVWRIPALFHKFGEFQPPVEIIVIGISVWHCQGDHLGLLVLGSALQKKTYPNFKTTSKNLYFTDHI